MRFHKIMQTKVAEKADNSENIAEETAWSGTNYKGFLEKGKSFPNS